MTTSGSGGPPRPIATTTTRRSAASSRATWPVTAVLPTRLPVPTTAIDGSSNGASSGGSKRKSAPSYGRPSASTRLASAKRSTGPSTGSSERSTTTSGAWRDRRLDVGGERDAVVLAAAELLGAADEHRRDDVVGQLRERVADDGGVVLAVDDRDAPSRSPRGDLVLDRAGELRVLERVERERDEPLLAVERVPPPDVDLRSAISMTL